ncbi:hypothetical protein MH1LPH_17100 [Lactiplantibacillus brownii]
MAIKRTAEGLEWPIDRKINRDMRKWSGKGKERPKRKQGAFNLDSNKKVVIKNERC